MNQLQTIEPEIASQRALFDYSVLDAETRIVVQQRAGEIKNIAKRVAGDVVDIGHKLADVKHRLGGNGKFNEWLDAELGWSERTAHNFIGVYSRFGAANFALENVAVSALYLLAAPSTPAEAVDVAKQIADSGEKVTHKVAKEVVRQAKAKRPKQVDLVEETEEEETEEEADETPSTAIRVYVEQSELDEMDRINACDEIDKGVPVEFYDYEGEPIVITSSLSSGAEGVISAGGWRAVPEKDAQGVTKPPRKWGEVKTYIGDRVNIGTRKAPNWWMIVGPEYEFERKPAAEEGDSDFQPGFPPGFDPQRAEQGLAQTGPAEAVDPSAICLCACKAGDHTRKDGEFAECTECECEVFQQATEAEIAERNAAEKALGIALSAAPVEKRQPAPVSVEKPAAVETPSTPKRLAAWFKERVEITITLMPGVDAAGRKVMHSVRVGEEMPFVELTTGEEDLVGSLPITTFKLVEKAAEAFAKKQDSKPAKQSALKSKPAAKKAAAKSTKKGGKK